MANPLPLVTLGLGMTLSLVDGGYVASEFAAIVLATAATAVAVKFWKMSKAIDRLTTTGDKLARDVRDVHLRLDKLDVPQSDSTQSGN